MAQPAVVSEGASPVVGIRGLVKRYGRRVAVQGVDLHVAPGQVYGLIGPDGAGKSSVLKSVAGVLTFDTGRLDVLGVTIDTEPAAERVKGRIGFLPQGLGHNLYPELSIEENVDVFARLRLVAAGELARRKERLLAMTRLAAVRDRPMKHLSGGMKQKLALACTLIHQPELLVLDEPTTGIDAVSRRDFWTILAELAREQTMTALVATAYMDEASRFHRVAFMYGGCVLAEGEPDELRALVKGWVVSFGPATPSRLAQVRARLPHASVLGDRLRVLASAATPAAATAAVCEALGEGQLVDAAVEAPELEDVFAWLLRGESDLAPVSPVLEPREARSPTPGGPVIRASGLTRDFGPVRAVDGVDLSVAGGEVVGLLGANGAGKTTVIKMLTGLLPPTAGAAQVAGIDMRRAGHDVKRRIGYVSQLFSLYHELTAVENIRLYAALYGLGGREARRRVDWALALAGLGDLTREPAGRLPTGMRQRLALGCALVHRPRALFLDEPTSGVDPIGRRRFWELLDTLAHEDRIAVIITTHSMMEAEHCDRIALMFAGRVIADATPAELKREVEAEAGRALDVTTDAPDRALAVLTAAGFSGPALHGRHVRVFSRHPDADAARLRATLASAGIAVQTLAPQAVTLEDVFLHRITARERETRGSA